MQLLQCLRYQLPLFWPCRHQHAIFLQLNANLNYVHQTVYQSPEAPAGRSKIHRFAWDSLHIHCYWSIPQIFLIHYYFFVHSPLQHSIALYSQISYRCLPNFQLFPDHYYLHICNHLLFHRELRCPGQSLKLPAILTACDFLMLFGLSHYQASARRWSCRLQGLLCCRQIH